MKPSRRGVTKRPPDITRGLLSRYAKLSKADWADAFFDLYRETSGHELAEESAMEDAERRVQILSTYRAAKQWQTLSDTTEGKL